MIWTPIMALFITDKVTEKWQTDHFEDLAINVKNNSQVGPLKIFMVTSSTVHIYQFS